MPASADDTVLKISELPTIMLEHLVLRYLDLKSLLNLRLANGEWLRFINAHIYPLSDYSIINCAFGGFSQEDGRDSSYIVFVFRDGSVFTYGNNENGQLGLGDKEYRSLPTRINNDRFQGKQIVQSTAGYCQTWFIGADGSLFVCGRDGAGGPTLQPYFESNVPFNGNRVTQIRINCDSMFYRCEDGTVYSYGSNEWGQLGVNDFHPRNFPTLIDSAHFLGRKVIQCWPGGSRSFFLCEDKSVFVSGGEREQQDAAIPRQLDQDKALLGAEEVVQCVAGLVHYIVVCAGSVFTYGNNSNGQLGHNNLIDRPTPTRIDNARFAGRKVIQSSAGSLHSIFVCDDGSAYACGDNSFGQLALQNMQRVDSPIPLRINSAHFEGRRVIQSLCNNFSTLFVCEGSVIYACGAINGRSVPQRIQNPLYTIYHEATDLSALLFKHISALNIKDPAFAASRGSTAQQILAGTKFYPAIPGALYRALYVLNGDKDTVELTEPQNTQPQFSPLYSAVRNKMESMEKRIKILGAIEKRNPLSKKMGVRSGHRQKI